MKSRILKKIIASTLTTVTIVSLTACNTLIKPYYGYNPMDYVTLGDYKQIKAVLNEEEIANGLIEKRIANDMQDKATYTETKAGAKDGDVLTIDFSATIGGEKVSGFSDEDYEIELGKDSFLIDGFTDALYGMEQGEMKIITLTVPEDFTTAQEYAGRKIVYTINVKNVQNKAVPMITDAYVKENFNFDTVEEYKADIKEQVKPAIDEAVENAKKQAVLTQLQEICTVKSYPDGLIESKKEEFEQSIKYYALRVNKTVDEYCQITYNISFDEYVERAVKQELILQAIAQNENIQVKEYDYKGDLEEFASVNGYSDKKSFEDKYGKEKIVKGMYLQKAQDIVMNSVTYETE